MPQPGDVSVSDEDHCCLLQGHWEPTQQIYSVTKLLFGASPCGWRVWPEHPPPSGLAGRPPGAVPWCPSLQT